MDVYLPLLKDKRIGICTNHSAVIDGIPLTDTLLKRGLHIVKLFSPEHGLSGLADAGAAIRNDRYGKTGIPVISLFGQKTKPSVSDLADIDILLFDMQDVGVRCYTYLSTLQECMEAAFENSKPMMLLDRPNPNGFYIDGPVLDTGFRSFVGMQPVPLVYGMTLAEYAFMIAGEKWLSPKANEKYQYYLRAENSPDTPFHFQVIKCANYSHQSFYHLPVAPSPNLPDMAAVYWYGSNCLLEGTVLNEGRGTKQPFIQVGHPDLPDSLFTYIPRAGPGAMHPRCENQPCHGWNVLQDYPETCQHPPVGIHLQYLLEAYRLFPDKAHFFRASATGNEKDRPFNRLAGTDQLMRQIMEGKTAAMILASWQPDLAKFKTIRKKYLLYPDTD